MPEDLNIESDLNDSDPLAPVSPSETDVMAARIVVLENEAAQAKDQMLRALAEAENTRKRLMKDREDATKYAIANFARDLLDFSDNFRRALEAIPEEMKASGDERITNLVQGLEAMQRNMLQTFERHGIKKLEPRDGAFNPHFHEVMFEAPGTGKPAGTIVQLVEAGYILHDRLLRAARVGIAKDEGQGNVHNIDTQA